LLGDFPVVLVAVAGDPAVPLAALHDAQADR
jgi:hypothetical protein